jgi:hypothetical protein
MPINAISDRGKFIAAPTRTMAHVCAHHLGFPYRQWTPKSTMTAGDPSIPNNLSWLA